MTAFSPPVSIIIPLYNGEKMLPACLESLLALNYPHDACEIIVVENGSSDGSAAVGSRYPIRLLVSEARGPAAARNLGIAHARHDLLAFTDADCIPHPDWLAELVQPYQDERIGAVAGMICAYQTGDENFIDRFARQFPPLVNYLSGKNEFLPHLYTANASYRKQPVQQAGGFDARMITGEDVDLSWRFQLKTGLQVSYATSAIIYHRNRTTREGLARQFRQYGYGEIILDTLYGHYPGYPRTRAFQQRRILQQGLALLRYFASWVFRRGKRMTGRMGEYEASLPGLWLLVESSNILGKLEALLATRGMRNAQAALAQDPVRKIRKFY